MRLGMLLRLRLKLKSVTQCLVNTNHIFLRGSQSKTEVEPQFVKSNYPLLFMCFLLSLTTDTFPLLSQRSELSPKIVLIMVNWQINLPLI
jgi:hypothetical protein